MAKNQIKCLAVVRIRGTVNVRRDVQHTLRLLHLNKVNHATLIPSTPHYLGMLQKAKDYITWGEVSKETILKLLKKRGMVVGGKKLTDEYVKQRGFKDLDEVAEKIYSLKLNLKDLDGVKPVFRLHPPSGGFKKTLKRGFSEGGELGYRGGEINRLIEKMV